MTKKLIEVKCLNASQFNRLDLCDNKFSVVNDKMYFKKRKE